MAVATNEVLVEKNGMDGFFLEELGISLEVGKVYTLKTPCREFPNACKIYKIKVHNITDKLYECEFL